MFSCDIDPYNSHPADLFQTVLTPLQKITSACVVSMERFLSFVTADTTLHTSQSKQYSPVEDTAQKILLEGEKSERLERDQRYPDVALMSECVPLLGNLHNLSSV